MRSILAESLDVLLDTSPDSLPVEDLITTGAKRELLALADNLPPILQGGLECRLRADAQQVDLQQRVLRDEPERTLLQAFLTEAISRGGATRPGWSRVQGFLAEWSDESSLLHQHITEIWLEFDADRPSSELPLPAIFFGFPQSLMPAEELHEITARALDLLLGHSEWKDWQSNLFRCGEACSGEIFISHIGVMLSRASPLLRVNVKRLRPEVLVPYLQNAGWQADATEAKSLMAQLFSRVDRITVCLDVGSQFYPRLGFECIFLEHPQRESRWALFLHYLVEQGLCHPNKRNALLNWPGQTNPTNSSAAWPEELITDSLLRPGDQFTVFDRSLSHVKVDWRPEQPAEAKAYLWFQHRWLAA